MGLQRCEALLGGALLPALGITQRNQLRAQPLCQRLRLYPGGPLILQGFLRPADGAASVLCKVCKGLQHRMQPAFGALRCLLLEPYLLYAGLKVYVRPLQMSAAMI